MRLLADLGVAGPRLARGGNLSNRKRNSIAQSLSLLPLHRSAMTERSPGSELSAGLLI